MASGEVSMKRILAVVVFVLLAFVASSSVASAQESRPASWDIVVSGSPDISIPLMSIDHSNGPTSKVMSPKGASYEVTFLRDLGGKRPEVGLMVGSSAGYASTQFHVFNPIVGKGAFQLGPTIGVGVGAERDGFRFASPGLAFHGDLTAAIKSQHGVIKIAAGLDSRKILAVRVSAGVGF